ncbi:hypothetical protein QFZ94_005023 [Paraburkholderia sp. JPY465]
MVAKLRVADTLASTPGSLSWGAAIACEVLPTKGGISHARLLELGRRGEVFSVVIDHQRYFSAVLAEGSLDQRRVEKILRRLSARTTAMAKYLFVVGRRASLGDKSPGAVASAWETLPNGVTTCRQRIGHKAVADGAAVPEKGPGRVRILTAEQSCGASGLPMRLLVGLHKSVTKPSANTSCACRRYPVPPPEENDLREELAAIFDVDEFFEP